MSTDKVVLSGFTNSTSAELCLTSLELKTDFTDGDIRIKDGETVSKWQSLQFHIHSPSEHTINGMHYSAELHLVFQGITMPNELAVFGFMFDVNDTAGTNAFIASLGLADFTPGTLPDCNAMSVSISTLFSALPSHKKYNYSGSLTTPPCSENVDWYVFQEPIVVNSSQLTELMNFWKIATASGDFEGNNRNVQMLNGRTVKSLGCTYDSVDLWQDFSGT
jgi:carbonic anhydrase